MTSIEALTDKQAEALGYVCKGMDSKEIARVLDIAPSTVDQRLDGARRKLGVATRKQAARIFAAHTDMSERAIYEPFPLTLPQSHPPQMASPQEGLRFEDSFAFDERASWDRFPSWRLPTLEPRDLGVVGRIGVILALTVFLLLVVVEGLRLVHSLGVMFRG